MPICLYVRFGQKLSTCINANDNRQHKGNLTFSFSVFFLFCLSVNDFLIKSRHRVSSMRAPRLKFKFKNYYRQIAFTAIFRTQIEKNKKKKTPMQCTIAAFGHFFPSYIAILLHVILYSFLCRNIFRHPRHSRSFLHMDFFL